MCCSCWAVTRTHHTHRPCSHPLMHRLKIASSSSPPPPFPRSASSIPHSPPLTCQFLSASTSQHSHQSLSLCFAGRIDGLSSEQVLILAAVYKARPTWLERNTSSTRPVNHDWALMCENLEDGCNASLTLQNKSTGNCKQRFPENLSTLMCVCVWEDEGEMKAFPREFLLDLSANEGKNQKRGGGMQGEEKKTEKKRRQLFI